jgi:uncharacterized phage protein (TIGR01671 family)
MNRVIKFRAWDVFNAEMVTEKGDLYNFFAGIERRVSGGNKIVLQQFTGLTDRNGTEIYEGDIIGYDDVYSWTRLTVIFFNGKFMGANKLRPKDCKWLHDNGANYDLNFLVQDRHRYEIIGNIHQNPELLNP